MREKWICSTHNDCILCGIKGRISRSGKYILYEMCGKLSKTNAREGTLEFEVNLRTLLMFY